MAQKEELTITDADGKEIVIASSYQVCGRCEGRGVHDHPGFENGITSSEWNGPDWDDESREAYLSGAYDVECSCCHGKRVELVPDFDRLTEEQRELIQANNDADREMRAAERMERRMCC